MMISRHMKRPIAFAACMACVGAVLNSLVLEARAQDSLTPEELQQFEKATAEANRERRAVLIERTVAALRIATDADATGTLQFNSLAEIEMSPQETLEIFGGLLNVPSAFVRQLAVRRLGDIEGESAEAAAKLVEEVFLRPGEKDFVIAEAATSSGRLPVKEGRLATLVNALAHPQTVRTVRLALIRALGAWGTPSNPALPVLRQQLDANDTELRYVALEAITAIDPQTEAEAAPLQTLGQGELKATPEAFRSLKGVKRLDLTADRHLKDAFAASRDPALRCAVLERLSRNGVDRAAPVEVALQAIGSSDRFLAEKGRAALSKSSAQDDATRGRLVAALDSKNRAVRGAAASALTRFGRRAIAALDRVIPRLATADAGVPLETKGAYLDILRACGPLAKRAVPTLIALLPEASPFYAGHSKGEATYLRGYVMLSLAEIGLTEEAYPFIVDGLDNSDRGMAHLFAASARAATALGAKQEELVPLLKRALEPEFQDYPIYFNSFGQMFGDERTATSGRIEAVRTLGSFGSAARPVLPELEAMSVALQQAPFALKQLKPAVDEAIAKIKR